MIRLITIISMSFSFVVCFDQTACARDFGKYGVTTEIKEEGFLAMILRKLKAVDMDKEQKKMQKLAQDRINEPAPVVGITRTVSARSFTFDPTYTAPEDVYLPCGKLLHAAGTKVNPLDYMHLARKMIFIDARDKAQEKWLKNQIEEQGKEFEAKKDGGEAEKEELVAILTAGSPLKLQEKLGQGIYFDQNGELTSKFGIKQVPAVVTQENKLLRIEEIYIGEGYDK